MSRVMKVMVVMGACCLNCSDRAPEAQAAKAEAPADREGVQAESESEVSDLDRDPKELFQARCEHGTAMFECDECRYEVGVVKLGGKLIQDGLIQVAEVARRTIEDRIRLNGEVGFDERRITHVSSRTSGSIRTVLVELGQKVEKGQALLEIDSQELGDALGEYLRSNTDLQLARKARDRQEQLLKDRITSEREYLQAVQRFDAAEIRQKTAIEKLVRLGLDPISLKGTTDSLGQARRGLILRAPQAGAVLKMHAVTGEVVESGKSLILLGDTSRLWCWADLYDHDLAEVVGHHARGETRALVTVRAFPAERFAGIIDYVDPTMDPVRRTVKLRISVDNPDGKLRPGMFASIELHFPGHESVLAVPSAAVLQDAGHSFVFVRHHDEYFLRRPVDPGRSFSGYTEIRSGLQGGETVVTGGSFLLKSDVLRSKMGAGCAD